MGFGIDCSLVTLTSRLDSLFLHSHRYVWLLFRALSVHAHSPTRSTEAGRLRASGGTAAECERVFELTKDFAVAGFTKALLSNLTTTPCLCDSVLPVVALVVIERTLG